MTTIRGSTMECLTHYLGQLPPATTRAGTAARKPIIAYCRCDPSTIRRWINGTKPMGMMLVRTRYFLASVGYDVVELNSLTSEIRAFGQCIADGKLDYTEMLKQLNYQDDHAILAMLHGTRQPTDDRLAIIKQIVDRLSLPASLTEESPIQRTDKPLLGKEARVLLMENTVQQIKALLPNIELLGSAEFTETERQRVRDRAGRFIVFETAIGLYKLSGERARMVVEQDPKRRTPHA